MSSINTDPTDPSVKNQSGLTADAAQQLKDDLAKLSSALSGRTDLAAYADAIQHYSDLLDAAIKSGSVDVTLFKNIADFATTALANPQLASLKDALTELQTVAQGMYKHLSARPLADPELPPPQLGSLGLDEALKMLEHLVLGKMLQQAKDNSMVNQGKIRENRDKKINAIIKEHKQAEKAKKMRGIMKIFSKIGIGATAAMAIMSVAAIGAGVLTGGAAAACMVGLLVTAATMIMDQTGTTQDFQKAVTESIQKSFPSLSPQQAAMFAGIVVAVVYITAGLGGGAAAGAASNIMRTTTQILATTMETTTAAATLAAKTAETATKVSALATKLPAGDLANAGSKLAAQASKASALANDSVKSATKASDTAKAAVMTADKATAEAKRLQAAADALKANPASTAQEIAAAEAKASAAAQQATLLTSDAGKLCQIAQSLAKAAEQNVEVANTLVTRAQAILKPASASVQEGTKDADDLLNAINEAITANEKTLKGLTDATETLGASTTLLYSAATESATPGNTAEGTQKALDTAQSAASKTLKESGHLYLSANNCDQVIKRLTQGTMVVEGSTQIGQGASQIVTGKIEFDAAEARKIAKVIDAILDILNEGEEVNQKYMEAIMQFYQALYGNVSNILKIQDQTMINTTTTMTSYVAPK